MGEASDGRSHCCCKMAPTSAYDLKMESNIAGTGHDRNTGEGRHMPRGIAENMLIVLIIRGPWSATSLDETLTNSRAIGTTVLVYKEAKS